MAKMLSANMADLEKRLNRNPKLKAAFLKSPTRMLKAEGIEVNDSQRKKLEYLVDQVKRPGRLVPGAGIAPQDLAAITITIGVDF